MVSKLDYVPNLPWDIPGRIWDMITFGTSIYPKSEVRFGMYEIRIPVWDIPKLIWDIGSVWATTVINFKVNFYDLICYLTFIHTLLDHVKDFVLKILIC